MEETSNYSFFPICKLTTSSDSPPPGRRLAVLLSGTNLQALIDAQNTHALPNTFIVLALSNCGAAQGLVRATIASPPIPTAYLALQLYSRHNPGKTRVDYDLELARIVLWAKPDVVVLAGWMHIDQVRRTVTMMRVRSPPVLSPWSTSTLLCLVNSTVPMPFNGGMKAFQGGVVDRLGVMVHRVIAEVDRGEPLIVREVPIEKGESIEEYEERLHRIEWEIIVQATRKVPNEIRPLPPEGIDFA
ncbi:phosphoribosylglycinamide formyltransferase [Pisolithus thermaeus]|nr:phosphoribosylglycinamide formyltransferase [Pisolithus thermaeus]